MTDHAVRATSLRLPARTHDYVALIAHERALSRSAAYAVIADEHAARLDVSLDTVTRDPDDPDGEHGTITWELLVLPATPHGVMLVVVTDHEGEVSSSTLRDRCDRRDGWSGQTTPLDDGRELRAALATVHDVVARHHATRILDNPHPTQEATP